MSWHTWMPWQVPLREVELSRADVKACRSEEAEAASTAASVADAE